MLREAASVRTAVALRTGPDDARAALAAILARAAAPEICGPEIIPAPARGPCVVAPQVSLVPNGKDGWVADNGGFAGRAAARAADVFDVMLAEARRADAAVPFTPGQVAMGRRYRDLVERHDAGGIKLSQMDGRPGGQGGDFMDAYLAEGREIEAIRRRVGAGSALVVRRIRPSARGSRRSIPDRALVDMVCLGNRSLSEVLRVHGWAVKGETRNALREALGGALDRMIGYPVKKTS